MEITKDDLISIARDRYSTENISIRPVFFTSTGYAGIEHPVKTKYEKKTKGFYYFKKLRIAIYSGSFEYTDPMAEGVWDDVEQIYIYPKQTIQYSSEAVLIFRPDIGLQYIKNERTTMQALTKIIELEDVFCDIITLQHQFEFYAVGFEILPQN